MKKFCVAVLFLFFHFGMKSQVMWQFNKDTVIKWYYYDGDEFNGQSLDVEKWYNGFSWTQLNYDMKFLMIPERIVFDSGACQFVCTRDTGLYEVPAWQLDSAFRKKYKADLEGNKFRYFFTSGDVVSKNLYERGYFELRFRSPGAYGMWPGFWLYGEGDEIDFFELKGEKNKEVHVDVHCPGKCNKAYAAGIFPKPFGGWIKITGALNENYNIISGEWQNGYVKWYLNGEGIAYYKGDFASVRMKLILGNGPALDGKPFAPGVNESTVFPNSLDVDYVRIWYKENKPKDQVLGMKHTTFDCLKSPGSPNAFLKKKKGFMYKRKAFKKDLVTISILPMGNRKLLLTSSGKDFKYKIKFFDADGKELMNAEIREFRTELDFSNLTPGAVVKAEINVSGRIVLETIELP